MTEGGSAMNVHFAMTMTMPMMPSMCGCMPRAGV